MKNNTKAYVAITFQAIIVGFSYLFVIIALNNSDTFNLLAHRFLLAAISVIIYKVFKPSNIKANRRAWIEIAPYSLAYPIFFFLFQTLGLQLVSSSESGMIYAIAPIITVIIARIVLKEKLTNSKIFFMSLSVVGVIYINLMNGRNIENYNFLGIIFILISAISFSAYNVFVKKLTKNYNTITIVYIMSITSCIIFNMISVIQHILNGNLKNYFLPFTNLSFIVAIIYLGVLSSLVSSLLSTYALGRLEASTVGLFNNLATVVSILAGTIFLHEKLYYYHYIGIIAILAGTIGFNLISSKKREI